MGSWGIHYDDPINGRPYYWTGDRCLTGHQVRRWVWVPEPCDSVARFGSKADAERAAFTFAGPDWQRGGLRYAAQVPATLTVGPTNGSHPPAV